MKTVENRFNTFRQGRISARVEARKQLVIRNNLEKAFYKKLNTLFRKFLNVQLYLYTEFGIYDAEIASRTLNEDFMPLMLSHYKRVMLTMFDSNESSNFNKKQEALVFGRSIDFESLVNNYFQTRQLVLAGISIKMAQRISNYIEELRSENLTLAQIAKGVSDKFLPISRSRAALISRTETHNAASFGNHAYYLQTQQDLGIKMLKKWVSTNDARTRAAHASANGQTVDMDEKFIVGGTEMNYAGDSAGGAKNVINCRCVII